MNDSLKPPVLSDDNDQPSTEVTAKAEAVSQEPTPERERVTAPLADVPAATVPEDGIVKMMRFMGIEAKHKKAVYMGLGLLVTVLVLNVFNSRQRIADFSDEGSQSIGAAAAADHARGGMILLLDPEVLVRAAVAQTMSASDGKVQPVDTEKLGSVIRETVKQYRDEGYIVMNKSMVLAYPGAADLTPVIAAKAGVDLSYGKMDIFTGAGAPGAEQGNGSAAQ